MVVKIIGLGPRDYVRDKFNIFDGFIVIVSTIEYIVDFTNIDASKPLSLFNLQACRVEVQYLRFEQSDCCASSSWRGSGRASRTCL